MYYIYCYWYSQCSHFWIQCLSHCVSRCVRVSQFISGLSSSVVRALALYAWGPGFKSQLRVVFSPPVTFTCRLVCIICTVMNSSHLYSCIKGNTNFRHIIFDSECYQDDSFEIFFSFFFFGLSLKHIYHFFPICFL